jgi:transposase
LANRLEYHPLTGRQRRRVPVLLLADRNQTDEPIVAATGAGRATVERVRKRFARGGLDAALAEQPRRGAPALLDGKREALIVALACTDAPDGQARWTARLLANRAAAMEVVEAVSESTARRLLKKTRSSRGRSGRGASRREAASSRPAWRACWSCTPGRPASRGRRFAWTS